MLTCAISTRKPRHNVRFGSISSLTYLYHQLHSSTVRAASKKHESSKGGAEFCFFSVVADFRVEITLPSSKLVRGAQILV